MRDMFARICLALAATLAVVVGIVATPVPERATALTMPLLGVEAVQPSAASYVGPADTSVAGVAAKVCRGLQACTAAAAAGGYDAFEWSCTATPNTGYVRVTATGGLNASDLSAMNAATGSGGCSGQTIHVIRTCDQIAGGSCNNATDNTAASQALAPELLANCPASGDYCLDSTSSGGLCQSTSSFPTSYAEPWTVLVVYYYYAGTNTHWDAWDDGVGGLFITGYGNGTALGSYTGDGLYVGYNATSLVSTQGDLATNSLGAPHWARMLSMFNTGSGINGKLMINPSTTNLSYTGNLSGTARGSTQATEGWIWANTPSTCTSTNAKMRSVLFIFWDSDVTANGSAIDSNVTGFWGAGNIGG
jgi:hypothetical protein